MAKKVAVVPGGVDYTKLFLILGGLCLFIYVVSKVLNKSNNNKRRGGGPGDRAANNKDKYVAKVDLRGIYIYIYVCMGV